MPCTQATEIDLKILWRTAEAGAQVLFLRAKVATQMQDDGLFDSFSVAQPADVSEVGCNGIVFFEDLGRSQHFSTHSKILHHPHVAAQAPFVNCEVAAVG